MKRFVNWMLEFKNQNTKEGDLAKDVYVDPNVKKSWGYTKFHKYLTKMNACNDVLRVVESMNITYKDSLI